MLTDSLKYYCQRETTIHNFNIVHVRNGMSCSPPFAHVMLFLSCFSLNRFLQHTVVSPGAPLTYFNDRGSDRGSYFIPKKIPTSEFVYPKVPTFV